MIVPGLELLKGWFFDGVSGVNAQLPNVPRSVGIAAPPACNCYDELTQDWVATGIVDRDALIEVGTGNPKPALILSYAAPERGFAAGLLPEWVMQDPTLVPFALQYVARKLQAKADPASITTMKRNAYETIRTAQRIIAQKVENAHTTFEKNEVHFGFAREGVVINGDYMETGDDAVYASLLIPLTAIDRWALGVI